MLDSSNRFPEPPKAVEDGVLGEDSLLLLQLLLPIEEDGEPGTEASDIDEVEPPMHTFLLIVRSMALFVSVISPFPVVDRLIQLLLSSKLFFELNFKFAFFEFKGVFMLVVKSTGSIWTPEFDGRKSIDAGKGRKPCVFTVSGSLVGESLEGKFRGSGNIDLNW